METMLEVPKFKYLNKVSPSDTSVIEILEGKYKDVEYYYLKVNMESLEEGKLVFEYNILDGEDKIKDTNDFVQTIGDILTVIIEGDNEDRAASTKASD